MRDTVAHFHAAFLPISETFIYRFIEGVSRYSTIVLTNERINADIFPNNNVFLWSHPYVPPIPFRAFSFLMRRLFPDSQYSRIDAWREWVVRWKQVGLVHAHFGWYAPQAVNICQRFDLGLVSSFYGSDVYLHDTDEEWRDELPLVFKTSNWVTVSTHDMARAICELGCPPEKVVVLRPGLQISDFAFTSRIAPVNGEPIRFVCVSRFDPVKGIPYAVYAFKIVHDAFPNTMFTIVGDGPEKHNIERLVTKLELDQAVILPGFLSFDLVKQVLEASHIYVQSSVVTSDGRREACGVAMLEAQALGLPIVATNIGGIPEAVADGQSGFLVAERDSQALAERMIYLLKHPEVWHKMGRAGRKHVEDNFNLSRSVATLEELYSSVIG